MTSLCCLSGDVHNTGHRLHKTQTDESAVSVLVMGSQAAQDRQHQTGSESNCHLITGSTRQAHNKGSTRHKWSGYHIVAFRVHDVFQAIVGGSSHVAQLREPGFVVNADYDQDINAVEVCQDLAGEVVFSQSLCRNCNAKQ